MRIVAVCLAGSLWFNPALIQSSDFGQKANDEEKYSASLVVVPLAKSPKYSKYQDGRQQVIYSTESEYPAEDVLPFISAELKTRGWKPLPQDFFNPDTPSSHQRGWTFFEDHTQEPWTGVYAWNADWENDSHDIVVYVLRYESPDNSTRNLRNLQVIELFIPADIAAKMRRDAVNASGIVTFKPSDTKHTNAKILPENVVKTVPTQSEPLRIVYELSLNRCKEHSCHLETATRREVQVTLEEEEPNFVTNYVPIELHVGSLAYQLRFDLRRVSRTNHTETSLTIGFSGRMGTLPGKQLTWGEKSFSHGTWSEFKMASVSGAAYSETDESVTPTLTVLDVAAVGP
jgi:hypothetical protein